MFNRFGQIAYDAVPLERFGLMRKWKKLAAMQAETEDLIRSYEEAAAGAAELEQGRAEARDKDLDAHAHALRSGTEIPEPEHESTLDRELAGAVRTRDALQRAVEGAMADLRTYRSEHAARLQQDMQAALGERARELAEHARACAGLYAEVEDGQLLARRLSPRQGAPENSGEPQDSAILIGPLTRQSVSGPARGEVEAILAYLASLGPPVEVGEVGAA